MGITGAVVRRRVENLDLAVSFYEALTTTQARRFEFGGAQLAQVGPFLLFHAAGELGDTLERVVATLSVDDLDGYVELLDELDAVIVAPPTATPNGRRLIARHPDGAVFEYVGR